MGYSENITYGFSREPKVRNFIYGMVLVISYFLILGIPLIFGYTLKIGRKIYHQDGVKEPPKFRPLYGLAKNGGSIIVIAIFTILFPVSLSLAGEFVSDEFLGSNGILSLIVTLFPLLITLLGSYIFTVMLSELTRKDSLREVTDVHQIYKSSRKKSQISFYFKFLSISTVMLLITYSLISTVFLFPLGIVVWYIYFSLVGQMLGTVAQKLDRLS